MTNINDFKEVFKHEAPTAQVAKTNDNNQILKNQILSLALEGLNKSDRQSEDFRQMLKIVTLLAGN